MVKELKTLCKNKILTKYHNLFKPRLIEFLVIHKCNELQANQRELRREMYLIMDSICNIK